MKIPAYSSIKNQFRSIGRNYNDDYHQAMVHLATQEISSALSDLVDYVHLTGLDLSQELLDLSTHPTSLTVSTRVAKRLYALQSDYISRHTQLSASVPNPPHNVSPYIDHLEAYARHIMSTKSLSGINLVFVGTDGDSYYDCYNTLSALPQANISLDCLKRQIIKAESHYSQDTDNHPTPPDNPSDPKNNDDNGDDGLADIIHILM